MRRFLTTLILAAFIAGGGWLLYHNDQINSVADVWELAGGKIGLRDQISDRLFGNSDASSRTYSNQPVTPGRFGQATEIQHSPGQRSSPFGLPKHLFGANETSKPAMPVRMSDATSQSFLRGEAVRVASLKVDSARPDDPFTIRMLADICQRFDAIALQNLNDATMLSGIVAELRTAGLDYVFVDQKNRAENLAIIFNRQTLMLDDQRWYTVNDPNNLMLNEPLVAWFRTRNAPPEAAFTFTLANVQLNASRPDLELAFMGELFRAIRDDGRGEDDVVIVGDFNAGDRGLSAIEKKTGLKSAIVATATNTENTRQLDNVLFNPQATIEFTGNRGVFDFVRQFNMDLNQALSVSRRMPVWTEFSIFEGHSPGRAFDPMN